MRSIPGQLRLDAEPPTGDVLDQVVIGQVELDGRDGHVARGDRVQVGAGLASTAGRRTPDPEVVTTKRIFASDQFVVVLAAAQAGDLDALDVLALAGWHVDVEQDVALQALAQNASSQPRRELGRVAK